VGIPVDGPTLIELKKMQGASTACPHPRASCIREKPGPEVAVKDLAPAREAEIVAIAAAISSSA
jgi:hypothetical protein